MARLPAIRSSSAAPRHPISRRVAAGSANAVQWQRRSFQTQLPSDDVEGAAHQAAVADSSYKAAAVSAARRLPIDSNYFLAHVPSPPTDNPSASSSKSSSVGPSPLNLANDAGPSSDQGGPPAERGNGRGPGRVSDHEYEVRLGRAVSLLRATLGDFMKTGLVDYDEPHGDTNSALPHFGLNSILAALGAKSKAREDTRNSLPPHLRSNNDCPVYHPHIVFKFRPPVASVGGSHGAAEDASAAQGKALPPKPKEGLLTFSGRTMYFGSAHILRHALSAIFSQTSVVAERFNLVRGQTPEEFQAGMAASDSIDRTSGKRQAFLLVRLTFNGQVRVTQQLHEYTVIFKYRFDEDTGLIVEHKVDRIEPAPGKKLWAGLSSAFARLAGLAPSGDSPAPAPSSRCQRSPDIRRFTAVWEGFQQQTSPRNGSSHARFALALLPRFCPPGQSPLARRRSIAMEWQRRRTYSTQSKSAAAPSSSVSVSASSTLPKHSQAADLTAMPAGVSENRFFSSGHTEQDMPGPSFGSIWLPRLGSGFRFGAGKKSPLSSESEYGSLAPASDDPSISASSSSHLGMPNRSGPGQDLTQYRPAVGLTSQTLIKSVMGLSKANLTFLVTLTGMAGYALCPASLSVSPSAAFLGPVGTLLALAAGTTLCSASANAINQLREIPYDAQMARTRNRVLPSRNLTPLQAASFATVTATTGVGTLALLNPLTAVLGLSNIVLYSFIYTPLKRRHIVNTWVGALVGAIPPLMGWAACTGTLHLFSDLPGWCLALVLYAWQFPHFNSLAHNLSSEYARGGYRMMSVVDPSLNRRVALRHALALLPISSILLPLSSAVVPLPFAILSLIPNTYLLKATYDFWQKGSNASARKCFYYSLIHLPVLLVLAMACKESVWTGVGQWWSTTATTTATEAADVASGGEEQDDKEQKE